MLRATYYSSDVAARPPVPPAKVAGRYVEGGVRRIRTALPRPTARVRFTQLNSEDSRPKS